ncbi:kelch repeat and BTB domain-containing protein 8-like [Branchiostoma lanceolatum]|uniref:kelch repeat and BTB domain-containing protein 8-like n=1 Tax=Branchiostoma lanceolatum TaxID=7740 RepID=UPI003454EC39
MAAADQEHHAIRPRSYQDESYLHGFLRTVGDLQKAGVLQDVVLEVEGRRFPCHRLVLSAASPYFKAMFTSGLAESRQKTVVLQGLDATVFWEILSYIYSGTLHVSLDKVQPLYQAADLLQLDYVRDTCSSYMAMNVERSTCVDLYKFAGIFSLKIVRAVCLPHIARNFTEIASSDEFCSLSVNQLTEIISHDELDVKEEIIVWEAVVRWVQHSREDRLHHLPSILPHIRFNLLTSDVTAAIFEHSLIREDPGSFGVIRTVVQKGNPNCNLKPRLGMTTEMAVVFNVETDEILYMNPREGKYITCSYPNNFTDARAVTVTSDNDVYILLSSGENDDSTLNILKYNHAENVWEHAGISSVSDYSDSHRIYFHQLLVELDHFFYNLTVQFRSDIVSVQMRKYNRHTDQWQYCSEMEMDGYWNYTASVASGPHIYCITNSAMRRYDPSLDRWCKRTPPMAIPKVFTVVAMGTEIFCTDFNFNHTMVYDTESDIWQKLQGWPNPGNLDVKVKFPSLFVLENRLHIWVNLENALRKSSVDYLVYVYDRSADTWRDLNVPLPDKEYYVLDRQCPVVRLYLPYLKTQVKDT